MFKLKTNQISKRYSYLHILKFVLIVITMSISFVPNVVKAETFSWEDINGKLIYGSKPPSDAINVKQLDARQISRYSHEKAISGMESNDLDSYEVDYFPNAHNYKDHQQFMIDQFEKFKEVNSILGDIK